MTEFGISRKGLRPRAGIYRLGLIGALLLAGCSPEPDETAGKEPLRDAPEPVKNIAADWPVLETEWMKFSYPEKWEAISKTLEADNPMKPIVALAIIRPPLNLDESRRFGVWVDVIEKDFRPLREFVRENITEETKSGELGLAGGTRSFKPKGGECSTYLLEFLKDKRGPCEFRGGKKSDVCFQGLMKADCKTDSGYRVSFKMSLLPYLVSGKPKETHYPWQLDAFEPLLRSLEFKPHD